MTKSAFYSSNATIRLQFPPLLSFFLSGDDGDGDGGGEGGKGKQGSEAHF